MLLFFFVKYFKVWRVPLFSVQSPLPFEKLSIIHSLQWSCAKAIYLLGLFFFFFFFSIGPFLGITMFYEGFSFLYFISLVNNNHTIGLAFVIPLAFDHWKSCPSSILCKEIGSPLFEMHIVASEGSPRLTILLSFPSLPPFTMLLTISGGFKKKMICSNTPYWPTLGCALWLGPSSRPSSSSVLTNWNLQSLQGKVGICPTW